MANYSADDVKRLREATAAGMLDCKKALDEADGNYDKALDLIRVKGLKGVTKREGRLTSNGLVVAKVSGDLGVMLELNCETDFVAKGERFIALGDELVDHLLASKTATVEAFLASTMSNGKSVQSVIDEGNATLGEKIEIRNVAVVDGPVGLYLHKTSPDLPPQVGVLVSLAAQEFGVQLDVMSSPSLDFLSGENIAPDIIARGPLPDAIFAGNDALALGIMNYFHKVGIPVPGQISVLGYDNVSYAESALVPLTTVSQTPYQLGITMGTQMVSELSAGDEHVHQHVVFQPQIIERSSTTLRP